MVAGINALYRTVDLYVRSPYVPVRASHQYRAASGEEIPSSYLRSNDFLTKYKRDDIHASGRIAEHLTRSEDICDCIDTRLLHLGNHVKL